MPRYARIHVPTGLFHIISRFQDLRYYLDIDGAREKYLELLGNALETHDCRLIAYCLMSSHVHLVAQLGHDSIGKLTKQIHSPFAAWVNQQRKGVGVVMADRPKSVLVHTKTYGMELLRYVHNNPVRAGLVERAADSAWSSHRAYMGLSETPSWLGTKAVFGSENSGVARIRKEFGEFVDNGRKEERRPEFSGEVSNRLARRIRKMMGGDVELSYPLLGPDDFISKVLKGQAKRHQARKRVDTERASAKELTAAVFEANGVEPYLAKKRVRSQSVARCRALVAWIWVEMFGWPMVEIADEIGVRPCSVSVMMSKLRGEGLSRKETLQVNRIAKSFSEDGGKPEKGKRRRKVVAGTVKDSSIFVLRRNRNRN